MPHLDPRVGDDVCVDAARDHVEVVAIDVGGRVRDAAPIVGAVTACAICGAGVLARELASEGCVD
jgi:hypothetical protein